MKQQEIHERLMKEGYLGGGIMFFSGGGGGCRAYRRIKPEDGRLQMFSYCTMRDDPEEEVLRISVGEDGNLRQEPFNPFDPFQDKVDLTWS